MIRSKELAIIEEKTEESWSALGSTLKGMGLPDNAVILSGTRSAKFVEWLNATKDADLKRKIAGDLDSYSTIVAEKEGGVLPRPVCLVVAENRHDVRSGVVRFGGRMNREIGFLVVGDQVNHVHYNAVGNLISNAGIDFHGGGHTDGRTLDLVCKDRDRDPIVILTCADDKVVRRLQNIRGSFVLRGVGKVLNRIGDARDRLEELGVVGGDGRRRVR